tara:strand:+ start:630 stop:992 length:363 start_codon:yes stop_codon:yes gene_type:complete
MYYSLCCLNKSPFIYILNDVSIKKEKIQVLNDCLVVINYGNKIEELFVRANDLFKYNTNLIHTHRNSHDMYVDGYKSKGLHNTIKFTCNTDSLKITECVDAQIEYGVYGEDERWDGIFDK